MYGIHDAMNEAASKQKDDPKPKRYVELYNAMTDRKITHKQMNRVCYAIADLYRREGIYRTDRAVPPDPGKLGKDASSEAKRRFKERADSFRFAIDSNKDDAEWISEITKLWQT
jgi:hypothetical protein